MKKISKFTFIGFSTPTYKCKVPGCGARHGGSMSKDVCPDCYKKGHR